MQAGGEQRWAALPPAFKFPSVEGFYTTGNWQTALTSGALAHMPEADFQELLVVRGTDIDKDGIVSHAQNAFRHGAEKVETLGQAGCRHAKNFIGRLLRRGMGNFRQRRGREGHQLDALLEEVADEAGKVLIHGDDVQARIHQSAAIGVRQLVEITLRFQQIPHAGNAARYHQVVDIEVENRIDHHDIGAHLI